MTKSVSKVDVTKPPMTTVTHGRCISALAPVAACRCLVPRRKNFMIYGTSAKGRTSFFNDLNGANYTVSPEHNQRPSLSAF